MTKGLLTIASFPYVAYAPLFVGEELGFFAKAGLELSLTRHDGPWSGLEKALDAGELDLAVGALWFAMRRTEARKPVVAIATMVQQCRYVLVTRRGATPVPFSWSDLAGKSVVIPSGVPTPWFAFREVLRKTNVPLESVNPLVGFSPAEAIEEVLSYGGDYLLLDIENAQDHRLEEVATIADVLGPIPWSVFCALEESLAPRADEFTAFRQALTESLTWLRQESPEQITKVLGGRYPNIPEERFRHAVDRYQKFELWPAGVDFPRSVADSWQTTVINSGGLGSRVEIERILPLETQ